MADRSACKIGIVVPDAPGAALVHRALRSIRDQSLEGWRLVILDPQRPESRVREMVAGVFGEADDRVSVVAQEPGATGAASINRGLAVLGTDLAIVHPASDYWAPEFLRVLVQIFDDAQRRLPTLKAITSGVSQVEQTVSGNHIRLNGITNWRPPGTDEDQRDGVMDLRRAFVGDPFPEIAFLFDRQAAIDLGACDESLPLLSDWDFHLRFCLAHDVWEHTERLAFHTVDPDRREPDMSAAYRNVLMNRMIRKDAGAGVGILHVLQMFSADSARKPASEKSRARRGVPTALQERKEKNAVARVLSDLNQLRKRWI